MVAKRREIIEEVRDGAWTRVRQGTRSVRTHHTVALGEKSPAPSQCLDCMLGRRDHPHCERSKQPGWGSLLWVLACRLTSSLDVQGTRSVSWCDKSALVHDYGS